ncbi:calcium-binding protein [Paragemmobacter ruber]|uniref:Peptidase M10 serralysin C-terminal domain-containing protein n=1 Tax=Paragemmobacter ruber TaxID=1985673 RepID=A0ABW9Y849_9RHOB|nr:M10 family metallopeptidase C-terminal domain-containing protein [Rhodobacter ruber]NBE08760.1 hypothetical protein [Rhodobacter ruber]
MARVTFTPSQSNPDWQSFDMLSDREAFVDIIFESQFETTSPTRFTLNYSDLTLSFLGVGLTYSFDSFGDVSAITGGRITGLEAVLSTGVTAASISGLNIPATTFSQTLAEGNSVALYNLLIAGNDRITAGFGADFLLGYDGNDTINGGGGHDTLRGDDGRDRLIGGAGADWLFGGQGADVLIGGQGRDFMSGNAGNDRFVFESMRDMVRPSELPDEIIDFRQGQDVIDLRAIDAFAGTSADDAFLFVGTDRFGSATAGEIRFRQVDLNGSYFDHTLIEIDVDGDARAEAVIRVNALLVLTEQDFLL